MYWKHRAVKQPMRTFDFSCHGQGHGHQVPKELVLIIVAVTPWEPYWAGKRIQCFSEDAAVVAIVNKRAAKDLTLAHLIYKIPLQMSFLQ